VTCVPLFGGNKEIYGGVLLLEEWDGAHKSEEKGK
jgi:hypothetical protein